MRHAVIRSGERGGAPFEALLAGAWLSRQPDDFRASILRHGRVITVRPAETIAYEGDNDQRIFGIMRGAIACYGSHCHDTPMLGTLTMPGQWFGFGTTIGGRPRSLSFTAREASALLCLGPAELTALRAEWPDLATRLGWLTIINTDYTENIVWELLVGRVDRRIVAVLLRLCRSTTAEPSFPLSQSELAEMANASRASVNKLLRSLEHEGLVSAGYGRIMVHDVERLKAWFDRTADSRFS
jgi:CRP-like cAMP-binding protein